MRPMKAAGLREVQGLRSRARRQLAMARITKEDWEYIDKRLDEVESRVVSMQEFDEYGREVW